MSLEGRSILIAGAGGTLGVVVAARLAAGGARLALLGRNLERLQAAAASLALPPERCFLYTADLRDAAAAAAAVDAAAAHFGRLDGLVHLPGGWTGGKTLAKIDPADLALMIDQHVWTSFNALQACLPHLQRNGWGRVVMISSPAAGRPAARGAAYAAGKAAQEALILALAQELKGSGVTANLLVVRTIDTDRARVSAPTPENSTWTTPEEIAAAIGFLLSDDSAAINGARIPLFGGPA